jgi:hypothetical protein
MRASEFTINIPINIKINGDGEPEVAVQQDAEEPDLHSNPVMVPPLQQELELAKAAQGKISPVIDKITQDDDIGAEPADEDDSLLQAIKKLVGH